MPSPAPFNSMGAGEAPYTLAGTNARLVSLSQAFVDIHGLGLVQ